MGTEATNDHPKVDTGNVWSVPNVNSLPRSGRRTKDKRPNNNHNQLGGSCKEETEMVKSPITIQKLTPCLEVAWNAEMVRVREDLSSSHLCHSFFWKVLVDAVEIRVADLVAADIMNFKVGFLDAFPSIKNSARI